MLDKRKVAILTEVVEYYIDLEEPIGSRTLSKYSSLGVSPATIRNEMSDLEDLGFLTKTHSSSGRIPSDKAYRFYVNLLIEDGIESDLEDLEDLKNQLIKSSHDSSEVYRLANKLLADKTSYTAVLISPIADSTNINYLKIDKIGQNRLLLILVVEGNKSRTQVIDYKYNFTHEDLELYETYLRKLINGKSVDEIMETLDNLENPKHEDLTKSILEIAIEFIKQINDYSIYYSGIGNILNFWSGENIQEAKEFIDFIEDRDNLLQLALNQKIEDVLNIKIGHENKTDILKDFSIITTGYNTSGYSSGKISVIGPTSMDYRKLVSTILNFSTILSDFNKGKR